MMLLSIIVLATILDCTVLATTSVRAGKYDISPEPSLSSRQTTTLDIDYDRFLGEGSQLPDTLKHALQTFKNVERLPSCNKMATSTLLHSCATLDSSADDGDLSAQLAVGNVMDEVKAIYAARLAICEMTEAKAQIPRECSAFIPTDSNTKKRGLFGKLSNDGPRKPNFAYPVYDATTKQDLDLCLGKLVQSPQAWTSYSNCKQNAASLCHAVRSEIEKDEQLHLYKVLAETTADVDSSLRVAKQMSGDAVDAFHQITINIRQFSTDLLRDQEMQADVRQKWLQDMNNMQRSVEHTEKGFWRLKQQLQETELNVASSGEKAASTMREVVASLNGLMDHNKKDLATASAGVEVLNEKVEFANQLLQQRLLQSLYAVAESLEVIAKDSQNTQLANKENALAVAGFVETTVAMAAQMHGLADRVQDLVDGHESMKVVIEDASLMATQMREDTKAAQMDLREVLGLYRIFIDLLRHMPLLIWAGAAITATIVALRFVPGVSILASAITSFLARCPASYVLGVFGVCSAGGYLRLVESPHDLYRRWTSQGLTVREQYLGPATVLFLVGVWALERAKRRSSAMTSDDDNKDTLPRVERSIKPNFWFNDPKAYGAARTGKWTV